jgi:hypothetical protein
VLLFPLAGNRTFNVWPSLKTGGKTSDLTWCSCWQIFVGSPQLQYRVMLSANQFWAFIELTHVVCGDDIFGLNIRLATFCYRFFFWTFLLPFHGWSFWCHFILFEFVVKLTPIGVFLPSIHAFK